MRDHPTATLLGALRLRERGGSFLISWCKFAILVCLTQMVSVNPPALGQTTPALGERYLQTVWTTEEGLPQNSVTAILQTRDGYLWLGTFGGLARFDGVRFTVFNSGNTPGLRSNRILSLCEGRDGRLWLGAETGEVMSLKDGVGATYTTDNGLPGGFVWALKEDRAGTLWVGTSKGLARWQDKRFIVYTSRDGLPNEEIRAIDEDAAGRLWLTTDAGVVEFSGGKFTNYNPPPRADESARASSAPPPEGGLWLGTRSGPARFGESGIVACPNPGNSPERRVRAFVEDREGALWISYQLPDFLCRFKEGERPAFGTMVVPHVIRSMYGDREGNMWLGTEGGGLIRLKRRRLTTYSAANGLPNDSVRAITDDGAGGVWIAAYSGLVHARDGQLDTYTQKDGLPSLSVRALYRDRAGNLWIGSNDGLSQFKDGRFVTPAATQALSHRSVNAIVEDAAGNLWVGTQGGLNRLRDDQVTAYTRADGLVHDDVRFITETRDGALWLGTTGGLSRLKDGSFTNYTTRQGLSNDYVRAVHEEPNGTLWLGTYGGGLVRFREGRFTPVTTQHGLFDDFISRILEDGRGHLWLLSNRGIFRVSRQELNDFADGRISSISSISYGLADGMLSSEGNGGFQPAGWKAADGKLWFPTIKGAVVVDPQEMNNLPPPVVIEGVTIDRAPLPTNQTVQLKPSQENLEIQYTGLSFSRPEQVKFKYQLVGLDHDWVEAGVRRTAYYSHLPPGAYTFKVMAENGDGVWSETAASLSIVVRPPFWRTWWFVSLCAFCVAGLAVGLYRLRVAQLKRRHAAQEEFSRRLINAHETERRRVAAELHDGLGQTLAMIKNSAVFGAHAATDLGAAKEHLAQISGQSAQAIAEVREIAYNLRPYLLDRLGLTKALTSLLNKVADTCPLKLTAEIDELDGLFSAEAEISIYRIIQESLSNIIKHAAATTATVAVKRSERAVRITIQDDGKGFDSTAPTNGDRHGFGLLGMSERVRMLGGTQTIRSAAGRGTDISIILSLDGERKEGRGGDRDSDRHG